MNINRGVKVTEIDSVEQKQLLRLLRDEGPLHRSEIARRLGVSRTKIAGTLQALLRLGAVQVVTGESVASTGSGRAPGRPGELLRVDPSIGAVVGLAFSYHEARVIVTDLSRQPLVELAEELPAEQSWEGDLELGARLVERAVAESGSRPDEVVGVGLGVPGPVDIRLGRPGASSSTAWLGSLPGAELATQLGMPIVLENTARLSLLAEARLGAGVGRRHVVYVKLSSGVGGGFLVDGRVVRGAVGAAGEIGHIPVVTGGRLCRCGARGCLEAYASVPAMLEIVRPVLGDVDVATVLGALADGERSVHRAFADLGHLVGSALATAANLFNPELVIVGGELAEAGEALLGPVGEAMRKESLGLVGGSLEVAPAQLGARSAALGAVLLALDEESNLIGPQTGLVA